MIVLKKSLGSLVPTYTFNAANKLFLNLYCGITH